MNGAWPQMRACGIPEQSPRRHWTSNCCWRKMDDLPTPLIDELDTLFRQDPDIDELGVIFTIPPPTKKREISRNQVKDARRGNVGAGQSGALRDISGAEPPGSIGPQDKSSSSSAAASTPLPRPLAPAPLIRPHAEHSSAGLKKKANLLQQLQELEQKRKQPPPPKQAGEAPFSSLGLSSPAAAEQPGQHTSERSSAEGPSSAAPATQKEQHSFAEGPEGNKRSSAQEPARQEGASASASEPTEPQFLVQEHKLGVSVHSMHALINEARAAFPVARGNFRLARRNFQQQLTSRRDFPPQQQRQCNGHDGEGASDRSVERQHIRHEAAVVPNGVGDEEMPDAGHAGAGADAAAAASAAADRLMSVTRALLLINADHGSAWNARKEVVTDGRYGTVRDEIKLLNLVFTKHAKSPNAWAHRRWCWRNDARLGQLQRDKWRPLSVQEELRVCQRVADVYPKNYYAWTQRSWVVLRQVGLATAEATNGGDASTGVQQARGLLESEVLFVDKWLTGHVSDHSALNHRKNVASALAAASSASGEAGLEFVERERSSNAVVVQDYPGHESLWCYRRFLCQAFLVIAAPQETFLGTHKPLVEDHEAFLAKQEPFPGANTNTSGPALEKANGIKITASRTRPGGAEVVVGERGSCARAGGRSAERGAAAQKYEKASLVPWPEIGEQDEGPADRERRTATHGCNHGSDRYVYSRDEDDWPRWNSAVQRLYSMYHRREDSGQQVMITPADDDDSKRRDTELDLPPASPAGVSGRDSGADSESGGWPSAVGGGNREEDSDSEEEARSTGPWGLQGGGELLLAGVYRGGGGGGGLLMDFMSREVRFALECATNKGAWQFRQQRRHALSYLAFLSYSTSRILLVRRNRRKHQNREGRVSRNGVALDEAMVHASSSTTGDERGAKSNGVKTKMTGGVGGENEASGVGIGGCMSYCEVTGAPKLVFPLDEGEYAAGSDGGVNDERRERVVLALRSMNDFVVDILAADGDSDATVAAGSASAGCAVRTSGRSRVAVPYMLKA